ncbi:MAG: FeoB-associated Cys-rich membrane protein [Rikenellaceae bacterium]
MAQEIIVWIIGVIVFILISRRIYKIISAKGKGDKCSCCQGCDKGKNKDECGK